MAVAVGVCDGVGVAVAVRVGVSVGVGVVVAVAVGVWVAVAVFVAVGVGVGVSGAGSYRSTAAIPSKPPPPIFSTSPFANNRLESPYVATFTSATTVHVPAPGS